MINEPLTMKRDIGPGLYEAMQQKQVCILLVDRCVLLRKAMARSIEDFSTIEKVTELDSISNVATTVKTLLPDVILLGTSVSVEECLNVTRFAKQYNRHIGIIVLRVGIFPEMAQMLIKAGVHGILDETATEQDLEFAIKVSATGQVFHSRKVYDQMITSFERNNDRLTSSEMQTLSLVMHGAENYTIAKKLNITKKTVEAHLTRVYRKLGVNSRSQAIIRAQELHLYFNSVLSA